MDEFKAKMDAGEAAQIETEEYLEVVRIIAKDL